MSAVTSSSPYLTFLRHLVRKLPMIILAEVSGAIFIQKSHRSYTNNGKIIVLEGVESTEYRGKKIGG